MLSLITELERAHFDPKRPHLARARAAAKGSVDGRSAWERLRAAGLVPGGDRLFRVTARELARAGHREDDLCRINISHVSRTPRSLALPFPPTPEAAIAYASIDALVRAEELAREYLVRLEPFRFLLDRAMPPGARIPVWRILGAPLTEPSSGPDLSDVEGAHALFELARQLAAAPPLAHGVTRFFAAAMHAAGSEHWSRAERPLPAVIKLGARSIPTPQQMIRVRLAHFPDPFEPLVEIWRLGLGIRRLSKETILLYLPHPAPASGGSAAMKRVSSAAEDELRRAVLQADIDRAMALLQRGVDPNAEGGHGTALHAAIMAGHRTQAALLSLLLDAGADPELEDEAGMTPLALAIARDERRLATALLDLGVGAHQRLAGGRSLLHVAARAGSVRMVDLLLDRGLDPNVRCLRGRTPLHEAALSRALNAQDAVRALIERGADPNARDRFGWTPLHHAATNLWGGPSIANVLIDRGARAIPDRGGALPSEIADSEGLASAVGRAARGVATPLEPLPSLPRNPELEEQIRAAPHDDGAWSVYADWLASNGDPRAELIHLGIAAKRSTGRERARLLRALRKAFEDRRVEVLGELQRIDPSIAVEMHFRSHAFEHGFLVRYEHRGSATILERVLASSSACFLRHLSAPGAQNVVRLLEAIGSKSLISLALASCATPLEGDLAAALPRVRRLQLTGLLPRTIAWPGLEELAFVGTGARHQESAYLDAHLPDLIRLRLVAPEDADRTRVGLLARAPLSKLRALSYRGSAEIFREIGHSEWFAALERLDLVRASDEAIARLEAIAPSHVNLRRVRVVAPHLTTEAKRALARRLSRFVPKVRVS